MIGNRWFPSTCLTQIPIFEWFRCGFKNIYQKDMCSKKIGLRAQNMITILDSIINIIGRIYMTRDEHKNLHFDNE